MEFTDFKLNNTFKTELMKGGVIIDHNCHSKYLIGNILVKVCKDTKQTHGFDYWIFETHSNSKKIYHATSINATPKRAKEYLREEHFANVISHEKIVEAGNFDENVEAAKKWIKDVGRLFNRDSGITMEHYQGNLIKITYVHDATDIRIEDSFNFSCYDDTRTAFENIVKMIADVNRRVGIQMNQKAIKLVLNID